MSHPKSEPDRLSERRSEVWKLRVKGWSIREIAKQLQIASTTVHEDLEVVRKELADETKDAAKKLREVELARLDDLYRRGIEQIESRLTLSDELDEDGALGSSKPRDPEAMAPLLNALKGISERRSKLLGLDAPAKSELTGADGGPVEVASAKSALLTKLTRLATGEHSEEPADTGDPPAEQ